MAILLDQQSFENVFRTYYESLCQSAYRIVKDKDIAEDITQDVFYKLWNNRMQLTVEGSLKSYLFRSVINQSISYLRKQKNTLNREMLYFEETNLNISITEQLIDFKETNQKINKVIDALPIGCRTVFTLSRFENMSYKEIAEQLNISIKTVENQMTKALKFLRLHILAMVVFINVYF